MDSYYDNSKHSRYPDKLPYWVFTYDGEKNERKRLKNLWNKLTDKEKALEDQRIAAEKAKIKAQKLAKEKARIAKEKRATEEKRIAKEKIAQEQAAAALKKRIKLEQAQQHQIEQQNAIKTAELKKAQAEQQLEQQKISAEKLQEAVEKTKTEEKPKEVETPWYKFW